VEGGFSSVETYQFTKSRLLLRNKLPPEYSTDTGVSQLF